ncbi:MULTISPECIES: CorA family divalent cation transporter [Sphingobacterium]|uniref:Magnesium transporter CorA n=1 Tax=Sphingobacterium litopenaei TaxID=2763500 RepID=A0ABR7YEF0_9SPHI|nr:MULTISPECIES: CorA family divalent cation transporter [Sphingobacterium]MBD1429683.1 magnesium transporter CorA [Sphingobacterium litopenaei]NGM73362.1 magnesium transporter CorA [Sphingobacterium sp. SGL-16]
MIVHILSAESHPFEWIDITNPTLEDFKELKEKFNLREASIKDCLEIGHLPKIEEFENYHFLIIRSTPPKLEEASDSLTEITDRISIFYGQNFVITTHRSQIPFLEHIQRLDSKSKVLSSSKSLVNTLVSEALKSFETMVLGEMATKLDEYEEIVFLHQKRKPFLKKLYYIKRQIDVIRSILVLYKDIVDYFHLPEYRNIYTQDLRDLFSRTSTLYRNASENTAQLLSIYFNIESNHTNEIMRILTIISVFFMPLTFIVGVYGMNFDIMPELHWEYGYPIVLCSMLGLSLIIYLWFKRKKWL